MCRIDKSLQYSVAKPRKADMCYRFGDVAYGPRPVKAAQASWQAAYSCTMYNRTHEGTVGYGFSWEADEACCDKHAAPRADNCRFTPEVSCQSTRYGPARAFVIRFRARLPDICPAKMLCRDCRRQKDAVSQTPRTTDSRAVTAPSTRNLDLVAHRAPPSTTM